jgi:hypothetical protein
MGRAANRENARKRRAAVRPARSPPRSLLIPPPPLCLCVAMDAFANADLSDERAAMIVYR